MNIKEYENFVETNWNAYKSSHPELSAEQLRDLFIMTTGLAGETGEVVEHLKKYVRNNTLNLNELALELGDCLHYLTKIALHFGFTLEELGTANFEKLKERKAKNTNFGVM